MIPSIKCSAPILCKCFVYILAQLYRSGVFSGFENHVLCEEGGAQTIKMGHQKSIGRS